MSHTDHTQRYTTAIKMARQAGTDVFLSWFNKETSHTPQQMIVRGYWDFSCHILTPKVCELLDHPEDKVALEIGYGGGRLINAACNYFQYVIGVDIHDEQDAVEAFLREQGKTNFRLLHTSGSALDGVDDESVDCVYSFIVLQHVPSFDIFVRYIEETYRCLKPGGVAHLYFGKFARLHPVYQALYWMQGYRAVYGKPANHVTLTIRLTRAKCVCTEVGFKVVETGTSFYQVPDGYTRRSGGQSYVTVVKRR